MNVKTPLLLFVLLLVSLTGFGQTSAIKGGLSVFHNSRTDITGFGGGISLEYQIGKKLSVSGAFDYTSGEGTAYGYSFVLDTSISVPYKSPAFSFRPEFRFYPSESMKGFFAGVGLNFGSVKEGDILGGSSLSNPLTLQVSSVFFMNPVFLLGLNLPITPNFCVEASAGIGPMIDSEALGLPFNLRFGYLF